MLKERYVVYLLLVQLKWVSKVTSDDAKWSCLKLNFNRFKILIISSVYQFGLFSVWDEYEILRICYFWLVRMKNSNMSLRRKIDALLKNWISKIETLHNFMKNKL